MRKSARETRKPDVFTFPETSTIKMKSDETDEEDDFESSQSTKKPIPKAKEFKVFNAVGGNGKNFNLMGESFLKFFMFTLFYSILYLFTEIVSSNRNVSPEISKWIDIYKVRTTVRYFILYKY